MSVQNRELITAEWERGSRIVSAVLQACDARRATAAAARRAGMVRGDGRWVLAIGKGAIGMALGLEDACGKPDRRLVVTVEGPDDGVLDEVLRSDHPLPTDRSVEAGRAVRAMVSEGSRAGVSELTVLLSGGASSLVCEPIAGIELDEYRALVADMLAAGWPIGWLNTVRRGIDQLKGGGLAEVAGVLPVRLLVLSDVIGDALFDVGSGPFVRSPTTADDAARLIEQGWGDRHGGVLTALSCRPMPARVAGPREVVVVANNAAAVTAGATSLEAEGVRCVSDRWDLVRYMTGVARSAAVALGEMRVGEGLVWGGEWDVSAPTGGFGGRCQRVAIELLERSAVPMMAVVVATDGADGSAPPGQRVAAGACVWSGMWWPDDRARDEGWLAANSYVRLAQRDALRPRGEPKAQLVTGPTGTNVNDVLVAWRVG